MATLTKFLLRNKLYTSDNLFKNVGWIKVHVVESQPIATSTVSCVSTASVGSPVEEWRDRFDAWKQNVRLELLKDEEIVIHLTHLKAIQVMLGRCTIANTLIRDIECTNCTVYILFGVASTYGIGYDEPNLR